MAAFDADGTLWPEDVNDLFVEYQHNSKIRDFSDLLNESDRGKRARGLLLRQAGLTLEEVYDQVDKVLETHPLHVFDFQRDLLKFLKEQGFFIYVVTASIKIVVKKTIAKYNLPVDKVLGMRPQLENRTFVEAIKPPMTYGPGKKEALLEHVDPSKVVLAAGNSVSDFDLLKMAKIPLLVTTAPKDSPLYSLEQEAYEYGKKNNWMIFRSE